MTKKTVLTREQYVNEINRRLKLHHDYKQGMHAYWTPDGSLGAAQLGVAHDPFSSASLVASIEKAIREEFELAFH